MDSPVEITFNHLDPSDALRADIQRHAEKLQRFGPEIVHCHVVLEPTEHRHHQGNRYVARIRVTLPGAELDVGHTTSGDHHHAHEDAYVAIHDAFRAMRRRLQDYRRKRQGKVKHHEPART